VLHIVFSPDTHVARQSKLRFNEVLTIGRDQCQAGWVIHDKMISRQHATIHWDNDSQAYLLVDRGSRNGVCVNGTRINATHLQAGDVIRLGETLLALVPESNDVVLDAGLDSLSSMEAPILLIGEQGVGKEHMAKAIHERSGRPGKFVAVDCSTLIHRWAIADIVGQAPSSPSADEIIGELFTAAQEGTILLNHIADLPPPMQSALVRVLERNAVEPANPIRGRPLSARVIASSAVPLENLVSAGRFRLGLLPNFQPQQFGLPRFASVGIKYSIYFVQLPKRTVTTFPFTQTRRKQFSFWSGQPISADFSECSQMPQNRDMQMSL
jgi:hypothetical protein